MVLSVCLCFKKVQIPRQSTVAMLGGGVAVISAIYIFSEFYDLCSPPLLSVWRLAGPGQAGSSQQRLSGRRIKTLLLNDH